MFVLAQTALDGTGKLKTPMTAETGRVGRPRTREEQPSRLGSYVGFRSPDDLKENLDGAAEASGRSLSAETARRVEMTFRDEDALDQAMILAYGADNGPMLHLMGETLRTVAPYGGEWLDDEAAAAQVAFGLSHLIRRLQAPDDGTTAADGPAKRVDDLLFDLGYDGSEYGYGAEKSPRARWAAEKRRRFGPIIGERLIRMRNAVRTHREAMEPRELAKPDPAVAVSWGRVVDKLNERRVEKPGGDEPAE